MDNLSNPYLDKIRAHFDSLSVDGPRHLDIPEWGFTIYAWPMTLAESDKILAAKAKGGGMEAVAVGLTVRARTSERKPMFSRADVVDLMRAASPEVAASVFSWLMTEDETEITPEDVNRAGESSGKPLI
jgi:hypothetical protein